MRLVLALTALLAPLPAMAAPDLVLAIGGEPDTGFDPIRGWGGYGNPLFQSTLLRRDADLVTQPDLAIDWQLSDDRLVWTITLREGVSFSDGTPLTAEDVAFTFTTAKGTPDSIDLSAMERAETVDTQTVRFVLNRPWITFAETFYTLGIVPAASYAPGYGRAPVGSGPYTLVSWSEGEQLIVRRNGGYHGDLPEFEQITFLFTGPDTGLAAAQAGAVHMVALPAQLADRVPQGFRAVVAQTVDNRGISMPSGQPVTSDRAIRQALNLGLDREVIAGVALNGHGTPAFGPADGLPWAGPDDRVPTDTKAATAVLDKASWQPGPDGIRTRDGQRAAFMLNYPASDPTRQALAEVSAELARPLGIEITPTGASWDAIQRVMHDQPVVFGFGSHSPYQLYALYSSTLAGMGWMNPSHYANPQVDEIFARALAAESLEASAPIWAEAAAHYGTQGDNAWVWLVNLDHVYLVDDCLEVGQTQIEPHGHGWPITASLSDWRWTCE
ncbi:ABC transporter substrate-binding protein [Paracoccus nototheniae]|uniref:ABC transporter substrate-binding protein n=1 Tax=Paracoccus nototheniae TaxID=2489002 RepID=A0ABW4E3W8_9RHOB|nr:ABC transporter substrate-binding protein [Paracoccus nototheniae]